MRPIHYSLAAAAALAILGTSISAWGQATGSVDGPQLPQGYSPAIVSRAAPTSASPASFVSILGLQIRNIDLDTALRLAGVRNPELMIARQRITEAAAIRQYAAAQLLPNINAGTNFVNHTGNWQQSTGAIVSVHAESLYLGAGAGAVGAGTVSVPGVEWNVQVSDLLFNILKSKQLVDQRRFDFEANRNGILLQVALAYEDLLLAEGLYAAAIKDRDETKEVARLTAEYARTGQGRRADANRAATELARREIDVLQQEALILTASARLNRLLSLDPTCRLHPLDSAVVPATIVADEIPMKDLLATAITTRPELKAQQAAIRQALLALQNSRARVFTPTVDAGYSAGTFGGGSNLSPPEMGNFADRSDLDVIAYWTLQNLGVGNLALIRGAQSNVSTQTYEQTRILDQVRDQVAEAYAKAHARYAQIASSEKAVQTSQEAFREDLTRIRGREGLPIEVLDSLRLLAQARSDYLSAILDYNRAELELYVSLGQPPADRLARPVPTEAIPSAPMNVPTPAPAPLPLPAQPNQQ